MKPETRKPTTKTVKQKTRNLENGKSKIPKFPKPKNHKLSRGAKTRTPENGKDEQRLIRDAVNLAHESKDDLEIREHEMHEIQEPESSVEVLETRNQKLETKNPGDGDFESTNRVSEV